MFTRSFSQIVILVVPFLVLSCVAYQDKKGYNNNLYYNFAYGVLDPYTRQNFGQVESRQKDGVTGEYRVLLPDNRVQIVRYRADSNGYSADITYEANPSYTQTSQNYKDVAYLGDQYPGYHPRQSIYSKAANYDSKLKYVPGYEKH